MNDNQRSQWLGFLSYGLGVAVGFFLICVATWADVEASAYDFPRLANAGLNGLRCPVLMTPDETGIISLDVSNPTGNQISPAIKVLISTRLLPEEFLEGIQLRSGESKRLEWAVNAEHIDLGNFILAKVLLYSAYPLPSREATCGIFVLNLPGTGRVLVPVLMVLSFLSMGWGLYNLNRLRAVHGRLNKYMGLITFLTIIISLGLVLSFIGGWLSSVLVLVVALLLIIILLGSFATDKAR